MDQLEALSVSDLLRLHAEVLDELRRRQVLRSANGPAGDYGELLFCRAFGWMPQPNSARGFDAVDKHGVRYQIKCRRITAFNTSRQLSFIRNLPDRPFDILAGVLLDEAFRVTRAALIPVEIVQSHARYVGHVNAWRIILRDAVWTFPGVSDVTESLRDAEKLL